nr:hypothetical protein CFP56_17766 [Quercus suber]
MYSFSFVFFLQLRGFLISSQAETDVGGQWLKLCIRACSLPSNFQSSLKMSKKLKKTTDSESKATNMRWTDDMDGFLLNVMLEEQNNGNRPNGTWSSQAYSNMCKKYSESFDFAVKKCNIKNRIKTLKDEMWEPLIEANPKAKKWKRTPIHHYEKLFDLFSKDRANGESSISAKEKVC